MLKKIVGSLLLSCVLATSAIAGEPHPYIRPDLSSRIISTPVTVAVAEPVTLEKKPFDTSFKVALAFDVAGIFADHATTAAALNRCSTCVEGNRFFRQKNGKANYVANAAVSAVPIVMAVLLEKKGHRKWARVLLYISGTIRFGAAFHNARIKGNR